MYIVADGMKYTEVQLDMSGSIKYRVFLDWSMGSHGASGNIPSILLRWSRASRYHSGGITAEVWCEDA